MHTAPDNSAPPTQTLAAALVAALAELPSITRDETADAGQYTYRYADLAAVVAVVRPVLARHGLAFVQNPCHTPTAVGVATIIIHRAGDRLTGEPVMIPLSDRATAQQVGSALSYARRYSLMVALGLATDDDDGAAATVAPARAVKPAEDDPAVMLFNRCKAAKGTDLARQIAAKGAEMGARPTAAGFHADRVFAGIVDEMLTEAGL